MFYFKNSTIIIVKIESTEFSQNGEMKAMRNRFYECLISHRNSYI